MPNVGMKRVAGLTVSGLRIPYNKLDRKAAELGRTSMIAPSVPSP